MKKYSVDQGRLKAKRLGEGGTQAFDKLKYIIKQQIMQWININLLLEYLNHKTSDK
jgi:hypothetical protein